MGGSVDGWQCGWVTVVVWMAVWQLQCSVSMTGADGWHCVSVSVSVPMCRVVISKDHAVAAAVAVSLNSWLAAPALALVVAKKNTQWQWFDMTVWIDKSNASAIAIYKCKQ
jgi:hypothetical protein